MLTTELIEFVRGGVAVSIATRDAELRPAITRGWGPEVAADGCTLTLLVDAPPGSASRSNLEQNGALAIAFSPPTIARALQVKGTAADLRAPVAAELQRAEQHNEAFCAEIGAVGHPAALGRRFLRPAGLVAVTLTVESVFDQTPGPAAGRRL